MLGKWKMTAQVYCNGPKAKYTSVVYKEAPIQRGKWKTLLPPPSPPSNSRWINYIEFGKKKTMLSSSMGLDKSSS
jgi:hypothetical protein